MADDQMRTKKDLGFLATISKSKSLRSLFTLALGIGLLGSGSARYLISEREKQNKESPIYKEAIEKLSKYGPTAKYVGMPFKIARITSCDISPDSLQMIVPIKGSCGKGNLIIHAIRSESDQPKLYELELEVLHTNPTLKWTFYKLKEKDETGEESRNAAKLNDTVILSTVDTPV